MQKATTNSEQPRLAPRSQRKLRALVQQHGWQTVWRELTMLGIQYAANEPLTPDSAQAAAVNDTYSEIRKELLKHKAREAQQSLKLLGPRPAVPLTATELHRRSLTVEDPRKEFPRR